jgi:hypothetical protein
LQSMKMVFMPKYHYQLWPGIAVRRTASLR